MEILCYYYITSNNSRLKIINLYHSITEKQHVQPPPPTINFLDMYNYNNNNIIIITISYYIPSWVLDGVGDVSVVDNELILMVNILSFTTISQSLIIIFTRHSTPILWPVQVYRLPDWTHLPQGAEPLTIYCVNGHVSDSCFQKNSWTWLLVLLWIIVGAGAACIKQYWINKKAP